MNIMKFSQLREEVCQANRELVKSGLVAMTWGNISGVDRKERAMAIKPSGVDYEQLRPRDIVVVSLDGGQVLEGNLRASSDTPTHAALYQGFESIGGIVHTHSNYASCWAQAGREIPCLGTTHADHFYGPVPITRQMRPEEIKEKYEHNTGKVILERFCTGKLDPEQIPSVLVANHGPFAWGKSPKEALDNAIILEQIARMALGTIQLKGDVEKIPQALLDKHFQRKHGPEAYYGQNKE